MLPVSKLRRIYYDNALQKLTFTFALQATDRKLLASIRNTLFWTLKRCVLCDLPLQ